MQPQKQQPDYGFIFNPDKPQKRSLLPGGGKKRRILIAAAGGLVLLIVFYMIFSLVFSGDGNKELTLKMAQEHTELVRITEIGEEKARGQSAKNLATTTRLTLMSNQQAIIDIANKQQKVDKKLLAAGQDKDTDSKLEQAEQRSQFDEVFTQQLSEKLEAYREDLNTAFDQSKSSKNKQLYSELYQELGDIIDTAKGTGN